jgi:hypothetical protein
MIPKKPVPDVIGDGNRFSDKIMRKPNVGDDERSIRLDFALRRGSAHALMPPSTISMAPVVKLLISEAR